MVGPVRLMAKGYEPNFREVPCSATSVFGIVFDRTVIINPQVKSFLHRKLANRDRINAQSSWHPWILGLVLAWFLIINAVYYWNVLNDYAPGILDRLGIEWLR